MSEFILVAVVVLGLWLFFSMRSEKKAVKAFSVFDEAEPWFLKEGIKPSSVRCSLYDEPGMPKHTGGSVVVGTGDKDNGEHVGFVLEVSPGSGVVESTYLEPYGTATHHRSASQVAKMRGWSLMEALQEAARQHRAQVEEDMRSGSSGILVAKERGSARRSGNRWR